MVCQVQCEPGPRRLLSETGMVGRPGEVGQTVGHVWAPPCPVEKVQKDIPGRGDCVNSGLEVQGSGA